MADRNQLLASLLGVGAVSVRPRAALDGQTPLDRLQGSWDPDDGAIQPILALARSTSLGMLAS